MPKSKQGEVKDVGAFIGGWLKEGRRKRGNTQQRSLVTLDADSTTLDFWDDVQLLFDHAAAVYDTQPFSERSALSLDYSVKSPSDRRRI